MEAELKRPGQFLINEADPEVAHYIYFLEDTLVPTKFDNDDLTIHRIKEISDAVEKIDILKGCTGVNSLIRGADMNDGRLVIGLMHKGKDGNGAWVEEITFDSEKCHLDIDKEGEIALYLRTERGVGRLLFWARKDVIAFIK